VSKKNVTSIRFSQFPVIVKYAVFSRHFTSRTLSLGPLYFYTPIYERHFPLARKEDKLCVIAFFLDFSFYPVMELKPQFWFTVKFLEVQSQFGSTNTGRFFSLTADKTSVITLKQF
jgi:hypothetical protein